MDMLAPSRTRLTGVVGDESGVLFFPPQLADDVIEAAEDTVYIADCKREMMRGK
jgi:hypothetical protein